MTLESVLSATREIAFTVGIVVMVGAAATAWVYFCFTLVWDFFHD